MSDGPAADAVAIRALVEAYAAGVDARRYRDVAELFTEAGLLATSSGPGEPATRETVGRDAIARALHGLDRYEVTLHVVANHLARPRADHATAVTGCIAHHLERAADGSCADRILGIRYADLLERRAGAWAFARREVQVLWEERRPVERGRGATGA